MEAIVLNVQSRSAYGKGAARKLRRSGLVPGVINGGGTAVSFAVDPVAFDLIFRKTLDRNTLIQVDGLGAPRTCLVKDVQRHPVSNEIEHIDFIDVAATAAVTVPVKVIIVGTAAGVKAGGKMEVFRRVLKVSAPPTAIPRSIEIDVSGFEIGTFFKVSQLVPPAGARVLYTQDFNLVTVLGKRAEAPRKGKE